MNYKKILERAVITFIEAAVAFLAVNNWDYSNKTVIAGTIGAGLSAAYNATKQYWSK